VSESDKNTVRNARACGVTYGSVTSSVRTLSRRRECTSAAVLSLRGLGWSGSTLLSESIAVELRPSAQGLSDPVLGTGGSYGGRDLRRGRGGLGLLDSDAARRAGAGAADHTGIGVYPSSEPRADAIEAGSQQRHLH
jgi:hypothetical protein